ncbi:hypothetical protein SmJEL517_g01647 [Synchytrium microbalum]|uniref:Uncharacterized protein n=1 Tax=Synchytrium microbalum TaxID=1806994 RepID=A0A507C9X7_9FUNG|nr:uncharacterized protein SmJEL517_g01647 [Synchytrium microbalum]TPX36281.1 hypothetical protein SmJEL517_g01647 [Synchytrium microbalum]
MDTNGQIRLTAEPGSEDNAPSQGAVEAGVSAPRPPSQPLVEGQPESPRKKSVIGSVANISQSRKPSVIKSASPGRSGSRNLIASKTALNDTTTTTATATNGSTNKLKGSTNVLNKSMGNLQKDRSRSTTEKAATPLLPPPVAPVAAGIIPTEGVLPVFITGPTQEMFKIKGSEDVTRERPFRLIPKVDLLADITARIAISDWYPIKKEIIDYPQPEILVHWDPDFKLGQNYFICTTVAAADSIMNPIVLPALGKENSATNIAPKERKWTSLGSEAEVEEEWAQPKSEPIQIQLSRKRKLFGATCTFVDREASDGYTEIKPVKDPAPDIAKSELNKGVQAIPQVTTTAAQTAWFRPQNFASQYQPITLPVSECDRIVSTEDMKQFVKSVSVRFERALLQNDMFDIFADDYQELGDDDFALEQGGSQAHLQEYQSFTDLRHSKDRTISCIAWHPIQKGIVAVSCEQRVTLDERIEMGPSSRSRQALILIWSFHDPIHPQLILEAPDDVHCFAFAPHDPSIVAAGCINGQVAIWDLSDFQDKLRVGRRARSAGGNSGNSGESEVSAGHTAAATSAIGAGKAPEIPICHWAAASSIESGHRMAVGDLIWFPKGMELNSHTGEIVETSDGSHRQFMTAALDGQVLFWDVRTRKDFRSMDLVWKPFWRITLAPSDGAFEYGLTKLAIRGPVRERNDAKGSQNMLAVHSDKILEKAISKFFCATEEGDLLYADWLSEKSDEKAPTSRIESTLPAHPGCISDLQRSPFFPDILLSVGGWTFSIWKEKVTTGPLLTSAPSSTYLISGRWSPTRPGLFFITRADGAIEIWDLMDRSHVPSSVQTVCSAGIASMEIHQYGGKASERRQFIAAGDDDGSLRILEVPRGLSKAARNERSFVASFFDREVKRLDYVQERKKMRTNDKTKFDAEALAAKAAEAAAVAAGGGANAAAGAAPAAESETKEGEDDRIEKEFKEMEKQFLESLGLPVEA